MNSRFKAGFIKVAFDFGDAAAGGALGATGGALGGSMLGGPLGLLAGLGAAALTRRPGAILRGAGLGTAIGAGLGASIDGPLAAYQAGTHTPLW